MALQPLTRESNFMHLQRSGTAAPEHSHIGASRLEDRRQLRDVLSERLHILQPRANEDRDAGEKWRPHRHQW